MELASAGKPRSGQDISGSKCLAYHASGAMGTPKLRDLAAWGPRIGKGIDVLYTSAIAGFKNHPAKGLCLDCSDEEIKAAVDYMVQESQ